jgi:hypothetical protein
MEKKSAGKKKKILRYAIKKDKTNAKPVLTIPISARPATNY